MAKVKIDAQAFVYPMPMTIVGAMINGKPNFLAVAWVTRVNYQPPLIGISLGKIHYTNAGIQENREFSVNIPGVDMIKETDYCGIVSGKKIDKAKLFEVFYGGLSHAPLIRQCPINMECRLVQTVELSSNQFFIGEIVAAHADSQYLSNGNPDMTKLRPFTLTMPDNNYWEVGANAGKAWNIGTQVKTKAG